MKIHENSAMINVPVPFIPTSITGVFQSVESAANGTAKNVRVYALVRGFSTQNIIYVLFQINHPMKYFFGFKSSIV